MGVTVDETDEVVGLFRVLGTWELVYASGKASPDQQYAYMLGLSETFDDIFACIIPKRVDESFSSRYLLSCNKFATKIAFAKRSNQQEREGTIA